MRRWSLSPLPWVLIAPLLVSGCGGGRAATAGPGSHPSSPTTTATPAATAPAQPPPSTQAGGLLADFPLDHGYAERNGDGSPVEITARPATRRFRLCGRTAWDPPRRTPAVIGVRFQGESEDSRGRTLALYRDGRAAIAAVKRVRAAVAACPDEPDGHGQGTTHAVVDRAVGEQSVVWTDTFYSVKAGVQHHDTGLVVYDVVRVGRAVLLAYEYGEGNGTPETRAHAVSATVREGRWLARRMRELTRPHAATS